jgi:hypothetical protein
MEHSVALQVVAEALNIAIAKGCFNLVEVTNIVKALEEINKLPTRRPSLVLARSLSWCW